jgi:hypothetical protein
MRKIFPLTDARHKPPQVVASIKNEVRKYLRRQRGKTLPAGADFWDFDCKVGKDSPTEVTHVADLIAAVDTAAAQGWEAFHVEILTKAKTRTRKADSDVSDD